MVFGQIVKSCRPYFKKIYKANKDFVKGLDFKDIKFPVKWETFTKSKKSIALALAFLVMKITKNIQSMYQKYVVKKKHVDLSLIGEGIKNTMFL